MIEKRKNEELEVKKYLEYEKNVVFGGKVDEKETRSVTQNNKPTSTLAQIETATFPEDRNDEPAATNQVAVVDASNETRKKKLIAEIRQVNARMGFVESQNRWLRKISSITPPVDVQDSILNDMIVKVPVAVSPLPPSPPRTDNAHSRRKFKRKKSKKEESDQKESVITSEESHDENNNYFVRTKYTRNFLVIVNFQEHVVDNEGQGAPFLYVSCYGATDENRHELDYILHYDQDTDDTKIVRHPKTKKPVGYAWYLRNWDSLGSCRKVEQYLRSIKFKGRKLIALQK